MVGVLARGREQNKGVMRIRLPPAVAAARCTYPQRRMTVASGLRMYVPRCYQLLGVGGCHRGLWVFSGRTPSETSSSRQEKYAQKSPLALCRSYAPG